MKDRELRKDGGSEEVRNVDQKAINTEKVKEGRVMCKARLFAR